MNKKTVKTLIALLIGIVLIAASPLPDIDEGDGGGTRAYCVAIADNPVKWGTAVRGYGTVLCTSTTGWIKIEVNLVDGDDDRIEKRTITCYNTTSCSLAVYLPHGGHYGNKYQTRVSGYYPGYPPGTYDESSWIRIY